MKTKKTIKKILKIIVAAIIGLLVVGYLSVMILNKKSSRPSFVFGSAVLWVQTGSMEPTIETKSYISVKKTDGKNLKEGDVIVFVCTDTRDIYKSVYGKLITHRIVEVTDEGYVTKGDAAKNIDGWSPVKPENVVAVYNRSLPFMTFFGRIFSSEKGLILIFVIFFGSCALVYFPDMIKAIKEGDGKSDEKEKEIARRVEEEVEKMIENERGKEK